MRWLTVFLISITLSAQGQNLVFNPSFEIYSQCPNSQAQVSFATGWFDPNDCSSDYFNACSTNGLGVPNNWAGSQPARTGGAYMGIGTQKQNPLREYVMGTLTDTLVQGRQYCVEFYVSLCGGYSSAAIDQLGAYFSNDAFVTLYQPILVNPQIESPENLTLNDTVSWTRIAGTFIATGTELYITIGNFRPDSLITYDTLWPSAQPAAYYYVDDISVTEIPICDAGTDVSICYRDSAQLGIAGSNGSVFYTWVPNHGLSDENVSNPKAAPDSTTTYVLYLYQSVCDVLTTDTVTVFVNQDCHSAASIVIPSIIYGSQEFFITGLKSNSKFELYDVQGRLIYSDAEYENDYWTTSLSAGLYVAVLTLQTGEQICQKVCVVNN